MLVLAFTWSHIRYVISLAPARVSEEQSAEYLEEVREVEKLTPEGSLIGMTGGGNIAYFLENRTIMNLDGLMNSAQYFEAMKNETARDFLDVFPLDFVYGKPYVLLESDPYNLILADRLQEIGYIRGPENFTLFKYVIIQ